MARVIDVEVNLDDYKDEVFAYVKENFCPENVFPEKELENWAEDHGWVPAEE